MGLSQRTIALLAHRAHVQNRTAENQSLCRRAHRPEGAFAADYLLRRPARANKPKALSASSSAERAAGSSHGYHDPRAVSRTGIDENTSKELEETVLSDILMTMSQIPDVNRELAEVGAIFAVFDALRGKR